MKPLRIAFGCQARVGKDTACEYLQKRYGGVIYHFSDPLYQIMHYSQDVCGFPRQKDVKFLQWIGTEWARAQKDTVWVDHTLNKVPVDQNCFIGDVRFRNEARALADAGFLCVRIIRSDRPIDRNAACRPSYPRFYHNWCLKTILRRKNDKSTGWCHTRWRLRFLCAIDGKIYGKISSR